MTNIKPLQLVTAFLLLKIKIKYMYLVLLIIAIIKVILIKKL